MESGRRSPLRPRAAKSANAASGHAVNFMAEAMPKTTPDAKGLCRCASTMARSRNATTGMSSPPVASGNEARGRMMSAWMARIFRRPSARQRYSATAATASVVRQKKIRASLSPLLGQISLGMPATAMSGR